MQPESPAADKQVQERGDAHAMEYYLTSGGTVLIHATTCMNPESTAPSERSQPQRTVHCAVPFMWNVQSRQVYREGKWASGGLELGRRRGKRESSSDRHGVSVGNENVLQLTVVTAAQLLNMLNVIDVCVLSGNCISMRLLNIYKLISISCWSIIY